MRKRVAERYAKTLQFQGLVRLDPFIAKDRIQKAELPVQRLIAAPRRLVVVIAHPRAFRLYDSLASCSPLGRCNEVRKGSGARRYVWLRGGILFDVLCIRAHTLIIVAAAFVALA